MPTTSPARPQTRTTKPLHKTFQFHDSEDHVPIASCILLNAVKGWGKTTLGAFAESSLILAPLELGYCTLKQYGRVPSRPYGIAKNWSQLLEAISAAGELSQCLLVLDALDGFEQLCFEHVCEREFKGDWGERGFIAYQRGFKQSVMVWKQLLQKLDELRLAGKSILLLSHVLERTINNPMGKDYDRFVGNTHKDIWGVTSNWCDAVLFGTFLTHVVKDSKGKDKGVGGTDRVLYTTGTDAYDAKNRFGMPAMVEFSDDPTLMWETLHNAIVANKKGKANA